MNTVMAFKAQMKNACRIVTALVLLSFCFSVAAQDILAGAQIGTVQENREDEGYVLISGRNYNFDHEITRVFLSGERVDSTLLNEGVVVRFTVNRQGILERMEIIGPASRFSNLEEN